MSSWRLIWLVVPLLALVELGAHVWTARRAPGVDEWRAARAALAELRQHDELVVVAPAWAEPLARHAFGAEFFPLRQLARPDASAFERAVEVSALGGESNELTSWRELAVRRQGKLRFRVLENPNPARPRFDFVDGLEPGRVEVWLGESRESCPWRADASARAGGLHGHVAFPERRFACPGGEALFAGVTVIEDQDYRPRRCIWAHPPEPGPLVIRYRGVPLGPVIRGYSGLSWFLSRDGAGTPVRLEVKVGSTTIGTVVHHDEQGWSPFELSTGSHAGTLSDVEFRVLSADAPARDFCFQADSR